MSPEQCRGQPVDSRSDIYSLGATLFHLIAGCPPFDGDSHVVVINKHCHESPPSLKQFRPEVSDATAAVVEKCLAKSPNARYADAGELQADIERLLGGEPTSMVLHPSTPDTAGEVLEFRFTCELGASPAQLWPYVSNTDRVNHALGLPAVRFTTRVDPKFGVQRFAETKIAGQRLVWQEHPYEWIEGRRMSVLREFSTGPFAWFVNIVELTPRG
jgi:serine/threonine protein kinase